MKPKKLCVLCVLCGESLLYLGAVSSFGESNIQEQGKAIFFLHTIRYFHLTFIFQSEGEDIIIA